MRVTAQTLITVLSAALPLTAAWEVTAYAGTSTCFAKDTTQYRILSGEGASGCLVFGQDMPGASCKKFTNGGGNSGPCDGETFDVRSLLAQPGTYCQMFVDTKCEINGGMVFSRPDKESGPKCNYPVGGLLRSFSCAPDTSGVPSEIPPNNPIGGF
ncbi:hypothetical protein F53441_4789 [Fusarium austroafricanum]|uniref:Secreted LysM effector LysM C-terminal domain-containing protein n=1 Tax=Fusarium austroafricanum TaxID=2364996 RepID=A0A8H4KL72_9HYPO|nr:hypothetical protein F53441_4789 [Fusarium austroafricanum]